MKNIYCDYKLIKIWLICIFSSIISTTLAIEPTDIAFNPDGFGYLIDSDEDGILEFQGIDQINEVVNEIYTQHCGVSVNEFCSDMYQDNFHTMHMVAMATTVTDELSSEMQKNDISIKAGNIMFLFSPIEIDGQYYYQTKQVIDVTSQNINPEGILSEYGEEYGQSSLDGMNLYFTGTIDEAYPGDANSQGFIHLQGGDGETVNVYLNNFTINWVKRKQIDSINLSDLISGIFPNGSALAICPTGYEKSFIVNIHTKGKNLMKGGATREVTIDMDSPIGGKLGTMIEGLLSMSSAPIAIAPTAGVEYGQEGFKSRKGKIVFDDIWLDKKRTNGLLDLPIDENLGTPSIDLGNRNGQCEFNGGRYIFHCPGTNAENMFFVSSLAICYKEAHIKLGTTGITFYGIGSSMSQGVLADNTTQNVTDVVINDGTFYTHSAEDFTDIIDVVAHGWYNDYTDLRLPFNTKINGGNFVDTKVYVCDSGSEPGYAPKNSDEKILCRDTIEVSSTDIDPATNLFTQSFEDYKEYGCSSIQPENNKIYRYVPKEDCNTYQQDYYLRNWLTVIPQMGMKSSLAELYFGGDVEVKFNGKNSIPIKNGYLFYANLGEETKTYGKPDFPFLRGTNLEKAISIGAAIHQAGDYEFSNVISQNDNSYDVEYGIYVMRTYKTNTWYMLNMPFDVANIYVIETLQNQQDETEDHEDYLKRQGEADANLAMTIVTSLCPDILTGNGSGIKMNLIDICKRQLLYYDTNEPMSDGPIKIYHYNPSWDGNEKDEHNAKNASFYLYEQDDLSENEDALTYFPEGFASWDKEENAKEYSKKWKYATNHKSLVDEYNNDGYKTDDYKDQNGNKIKLSDGIVMQKGVTYAMYLPDGEKRRYWDGKYLIFEGYGPQEIKGKGEYNPLRPVKDDDDMNYVTGDVVGLQGNITFKNDTVSPEYTVFKPRNGVSQKFTFERTTGEAVFLPGEVYAVLSKDATDSGIQNIAATQSRVSLPTNTNNSNTTTSIPLANGNSALIAWSDNGLHLQSFSKQHITIYTLNGLRIFSTDMEDGSHELVHLTEGIYIIQGDNNICKVVVD